MAFFKASELQTRQPLKPLLVTLHLHILTSGVRGCDIFLSKARCFTRATRLAVRCRSHDLLPLLTIPVLNRPLRTWKQKMNPTQQNSLHPSPATFPLSFPFSTSLSTPHHSRPSPGTSISARPLSSPRCSDTHVANFRGCASFAFRTLRAVFGPVSPPLCETPLLRLRVAPVS